MSPASALTMASQGAMALPVNRVVHGDCTKVMAALPPQSVDFVLTDPPYLVNYRSRDGRRVANDNNAAWLEPAFRETYRVMKPGSLCLIVDEPRLFGAGIAEADKLH